MAAAIAHLTESKGIFDPLMFRGIHYNCGANWEGYLNVLLKGSIILPNVQLPFDIIPSGPCAYDHWLTGDFIVQGKSVNKLVNK